MEYNRATLTQRIKNDECGDREAVIMEEIKEDNIIMWAMDFLF